MEKQAKRRGPKPVAPVEINTVRYEVKMQDGGVIAAVDIATGKELWRVMVYQTIYDENKEQDVQEVYITKLTPSQDNSMLQVENEAHKSYLVNLSTHEVLEVTKK